MSNRIEAIVKPELLKWARDSFGLSIEEAARKIGVKTSKLEEWEAGISHPSISKLRKISNVYKRPLAVFFLPEVPKTFDAMKDFRRIAEIGEIKKSPNLLLEIRRAYYRREVALEIDEEMDEEITDFDIHFSIHDDPEKVAINIRDVLKISNEQQLKIKEGYEALNFWKNTIEKLNILIFQTSQYNRIDVYEMRGFSISAGKFPVIVVNSKDSINGKIFTLLHEFTHIVLDNGGICDLEDYRSIHSENQRIEVFCNHVAGAVLVPPEILLNIDIVKEKKGNQSWNNDELSFLSSFFSVSKEVVLRRLLILGLTNESFYNTKREEFIEFYKSLESKKQEGFAPYYRLVVRNNGNYFVRLILNAYYQQVISSSQLSDFLGTKLKHIPQIESVVF